MPRTKPYTAIGIRRLKCFRCGARAGATWQICSDGGIFRPICHQCDVELNYWVLRWMNFPDWEAKFKQYVDKVQKEWGFTADFEFIKQNPPFEE